MKSLRMRWAAAAIAVAVHAVPAAGEPGDLRCEYRKDPLGIDAAGPRLSWIMQDGGHGAGAQRQTAYQILVASTPEGLARGEGDVWDSGRVAGDPSAHIEYAGRPLEPATRYGQDEEGT